MKLKKMLLILTLAISSNTFAQTPVAVAPLVDGIEVGGVYYNGDDFFSNIIRREFDLIQHIGVQGTKQWFYRTPHANWMNYGTLTYADGDKLIGTDQIVRTVAPVNGPHRIPLDHRSFFTQGLVLRKLEPNETETYTVIGTQN